ncbi:MAG: hypothetical protein C5S48_05695 [Candidatus Methanogaster sp.]|nr:MAG: hypothetical protein C5S48_05695 [ANME-2 cluster archaeon]
MALFPPDVTASVQYGNRFRAMAVYQTNYQFVPLERVGDFFEDIFGHRPTEAFILQANAICAENVRPANDVIKELLIMRNVHPCSPFDLCLGAGNFWMGSVGRKSHNPLT